MEELSHEQACRLITSGQERKDMEIGMQKKVLIVDDMELNRDMLEDILSEEYQVIKAAGGREAIQLLTMHKNEIEVVLLDILMPDVDGYAVLDFMRREKMIGKIPVLIISTEASGSVEAKCFQLGVSDFIRKPFADYQVRVRVKNILELFTYQNKLETEVEHQMLTVRRQYTMLKNQAEQLQKSNDKITDVLATVIEYRSLEDSKHIQNVKCLTRWMAIQMAKDYPEYHLTDKKIEVIVAASALHDIGKIAIPDAILLKPGRLNAEERDYMKSHTIRGAEMIENIEGVWDNEYKRIGSTIARSHHERFDGNGYPDGLKGDEIPVEAQIVSIIDVYDALVSERSYKSAFSPEEAIHMITSGECGVFALKLLASFRKISEQLMDVREES